MIDSFNGAVDKEKAVLVHYRNICYGIHHIKAQRKRERYIAQQNYIGEATPESDEIVNKLITGSLTTRLTYCLNEHLLRKKLLENIISSRNFDAIDFIEIPITLDNPIFSGRSTCLLHKNHRLFAYSGYSHMPWITYMTLLTSNSSHLVFCWLKKDKDHARDLKTLLRGNQFKKIIEVLAYGCSDSFAVKKEFYKKHCHTIDEIIKMFRTY